MFTHMYKCKKQNNETFVQPRGRGKAAAVR